jgi:uncharacterized protein
MLPVLRRTGSPFQRFQVPSGQHTRWIFSEQWLTGPWISEKQPGPGGTGVSPVHTLGLQNGSVIDGGFRLPCENFNKLDFLSKPTAGDGGAMAISKELLEILACPKCKGDIHLNETGDGLVCDKCRLLYEIKDDIPIMLIDEAKPLP